MKLILCSVIVLGFAYIGFCISKTYILRKKFFFCFGNFLNDLRVDVNFSSKKLNEILSSYKCSSKEFECLLNNYKNALINSQITKEGVFNKVNVLNEEEKDSVYSFFKSLGKTDIFSQVSLIDGAIQINKNYQIRANEDSAKYSSLNIKLGLIIGAFVALIII